MLKNIFGTDMAALVLRVGLAAILLVHGGLKALAAPGTWAEGYGLKLPETVQMAVTYGEILCGVVLLAGLGTRLASLVVVVLQAGAIIYVTGASTVGNVEVTYQGAKQPLVYEWSVNYALIISAAALFLLGGGMLSLDRILFGRKKAPATTTPPAPSPGPTATV